MANHDIIRYFTISTVVYENIYSSDCDNTLKPQISKSKMQHEVWPSFSSHMYWSPEYIRIWL